MSFTTYLNGESHYGEAGRERKSSDTSKSCDIFLDLERAVNRADIGALIKGRTAIIMKKGWDYLQRGVPRNAIE